MVKQALQVSGFDVKPLAKLDASALRNYPTTWAKRLGYGRDPLALCLRAVYSGIGQAQAGSRQQSVCASL
jgi:hypothetical protein